MSWQVSWMWVAGLGWLGGWVWRFDLDPSACSLILPCFVFLPHVWAAWSLIVCNPCCAACSQA